MRRAVHWAMAFLWLAGPALAESRQILSFDDLQGWDGDDHAAALSAFRKSCMDIDGDDWAALCDLAARAPAARAYFELFFRPVLIEDGAPPMVTGYFEPELAGSLTPTARFRHPVLGVPAGHVEGTPGPTRREILEGGAYAGQGLEIAWVEDGAGLFYMQVQGSGRIRLTDGSVLRLGFGGSNGHPYRSPGKELARQGIYDPHQVSARVVGNWVRRNPDAGRELLLGSDSYVFFRRIANGDPALGPRGAMNRPLTAGRSIAVDPAFVPLGAPVWLEKRGKAPLRRLVIAQDTGSAIKGAQRADLFTGSGAVAGHAAAQLKDKGRLVVLLPIDRALAMADPYQR